MRELPLYNGAVRQTAQQQFARVQAPHVENMGHMVDGALEQLVGVSDKVIKLHDFGVQQDVEAKQRANDIEAEKEFMRRSALPWGDEESFYLPDGRVNEDVVNRYIAEQQKKNALVEGNYWGGDAKLEHAARIADVNGRLAQKVTIGLAAQENENRKRAFEANYALAVERGDMPGALRVLADAERAGQLLPAEVAKRKLQLHKKQLKDIGAAGGSVVVNGQEYCGASAGLAVAMAKEGVGEVEGTKYEGQGTKYGVQSGALTLDEGMLSEARMADAEGTPLTLNEGMMQEGGTPNAVNWPMTLQGVVAPEDIGAGPVLGIEGMRTLGADGEMPVLSQPNGAAARSMTLSESKLSQMQTVDADYIEQFYSYGEPAKDAAGMSEEARSWTLLPERDVREFFDAMNDTVHLKVNLREDGVEEYYCEVYAPDVVQRVVARANAAGELSAADASEMVTVIALDALHADPEASVDSVVKMFDGAGVYEVLGDGDVSVGKVRVAALVRDSKERMGSGTNKLGMTAIERMVEARVAELMRVNFVEVEYLNPRRKKVNGKYEKWDARDSGDVRWHALKHIYLGMRRQYNPALPEGASHEEIMDEFDENAQDFFEWYKAGVGKQREAEYKAMMTDWYMGQVSMRLTDAYVGGGRYGDGAGGYASDVSIARGVLRMAPPAEVNADVLAKQHEERQKADEKRAAGMRKAAAEQYAKLKGLKEANSAEKQREEAAKKKAEEKAAREEEKRQKTEEKKAAQLEQRKLEVKRAQPRQSAWVWDGQQAADGEEPACTLPRAEWDALVDELGYDGSTNVYVRLAGKKVLVTGYHEGEALRLNTPAAMLLQDRKKKVLKVRGTLGYHYSFK